MAQAKTQVLFQMDNADYKKGYKEVERINKELSKSSQQLNRKLKRQETQLKSMKGSINSFTNSLKSLAVVMAGGVSIASIIGTTKENEQVISSLVAIEGTVEKARARFQELNNLSRLIPQDFNEISKSAQRLSRTGITPTAEIMTDLSAIAVGTGRNLQEVSDALSGAILGEIGSLKNFGVQAVKVGNEVQATFKGQTTTFKNNREEWLKYIHTISDGNFKQALEVQMGGLTGAFKNVNDAWSDFEFALGENGFGELIASSMRNFAQFLDRITQLINNSDIAVAFNYISQSMSKSFNVFVDTVLGGFENVSDSAITSSGGIGKTIADLVATIQGYFSAFFAYTAQGFTDLSNIINSGITQVKDWYANGRKLSFDFFNNGEELDQYFKKGEDGVNEFYEVLKKRFDEIDPNKLKKIIRNIGVDVDAELKRLIDKGYPVAVDSNATFAKIYADKLYADWQAINGAVDEVNKQKDALVKKMANDEKYKENLEKNGVFDPQTYIDANKKSVDEIAKAVAEQKQKMSKAFEELNKERNKPTNGNTDDLGSSTTKYNLDKMLNDWRNYYSSLQKMHNEQTLTVQQLEDLRYQSELAKLEEFHKKGLASETEYKLALETLQTEHEQKINDIKSKAYEKYQEQVEKVNGKSDQNNFLGFSNKAWDGLTSGLNSLADAFGNLTQGMNESSRTYRALFAIQKGFAIASSMLACINAWAKALGNSPDFYTGLANYASAISLTTGIMSQLQSVEMMDKGGFLQSGKTAVVGEIGPELVTGPANVVGRRETANLLKNGNSENNISVNLYEDQSKAGQVEQSQIDDNYIINVFVSNIRQGGRVANTLQNTYSLNRKGV